MALSMAKGFLKNGKTFAKKPNTDWLMFIPFIGTNPENIWAVAPREDNLKNFSDLGCHTTPNAEKVFQNSKADQKTEFIVFLCTKPKIPFETKNFFDFFASTEYRNSTSKGSSFYVVSVMLGVSVKKLESSIREKTAQHYHINRVMPNLGCEVNASPMVTTFAPTLNPTQKSNLETVLSALGPVFDVVESVLDASVGISGSGLGFYCTFLQALADGAVADGLAREDAIRMGAQTAVAMGKLILEGKHPIMLRDSICSPAGSTIAGVQMLEEGKFSSLVMNVVKATSAKGRSVGAKIAET